MELLTTLIIRGYSQISDELKRSHCAHFDPAWRKHCDWTLESIFLHARLKSLMWSSASNFFGNHNHRTAISLSYSMYGQQMVTRTLTELIASWQMRASQSCEGTRLLESMFCLALWSSRQNLEHVTNRIQQVQAMWKSLLPMLVKALHSLQQQRS